MTHWIFPSHWLASLMLLSFGGCLGMRLTWFLVAAANREAGALRGELQGYLKNAHQRAFQSYANGVHMGMSVRPSFVRDGKLEHWDCDADTCIRNLTSVDTYRGEE